MDELKALNFAALAIALVVALLGMFAHYIKKWLRGETHDTLLHYLFGAEAWKNTVQAVFTVVAAVGSMFIAGQVDISTFAGLLALFTIGYAGDSALNKDNHAAMLDRLVSSKR